MKHQRGFAHAKDPQPMWPRTLRNHFNRHGIATAAPEAKTVLALLHEIRSEQRTQGDHRCDAASADVIAQRCGYSVRAARWIMQSLKHDEATIFAAALRPLRESCDRHGRLRVPVRAGEAASLLAVIRYYADANAVAPAAAIRTLFGNGDPGVALDEAAAYALYFALRHAARGTTSPASQSERAATTDWTPAIEAAFDHRGQPRMRLPRRTAMTLLARIARDANRACVRWGFDEPGSQAAREFAGLRRACMLLHSRTHVASPVHAMLIIASLKMRSKSTLLFAPLTPLA